LVGSQSKGDEIFLKHWWGGGLYMGGGKWWRGYLHIQQRFI